jgi:hypothetical protein
MELANAAEPAPGTPPAPAAAPAPASAPAPAAAAKTKTKSKAPAAKSKTAPAPKKRLLVLTVAASPGVALAGDSLSRLGARLVPAVQNALPDHDVLSAAPKGGRGFQVRATIAERKIEPTPAGTKVTIQLRATVSTVPEAHLRTALSAKANATSSTAQDLEGIVTGAVVEDLTKSIVGELGRLEKR